MTSNYDGGKRFSFELRFCRYTELQLLGELIIYLIMDIHNLLYIKMQGNLYEHISARYVSLCNEIFVNIDYYTVNQGKVYIIEKDNFGNDRLTQTEDSLQELDLTGKNIGSYKPNSVERKVLNMSIELFKTKLGL